MRRVLIPPDLSPALRAHGPPPGPVQNVGGQSMGTTWSAKFAAPAVLPLPTVQEDLQHTLDRIVAQMSQWCEDSDLTRFNRATTDSWHGLPDEFFGVLECALELARATDGAYDPAIGSLTRLWGFGADGPRSTPPAPSEVADARETCGWQRLTLDADTRCARQGGVELDFGGIAKGFAVDRLADYLSDLGVDHYLVEVGGELRGRGCKPDGNPWWVAIEQPDIAHTGHTIAALHEFAVATSGDRYRYFDHDGRRYSHTLDPRTGYPVDNDITSVTVLHPLCMQADALATALTVLGPANGVEYARRHDIAALFTVRTPGGATEYLTPALSVFLSSGD
jgi:thiamine biosynthesis lipoprotein